VEDFPTGYIDQMKHRLLAACCILLLLLTPFPALAEVAATVVINNAVGF
jgi:hypothetical protein